MILCMVWLTLYHDILESHTMTMKLAMPGLPRFEWKGSFVHAPSRVNSFLRAQEMVENGCLAYLAFVRDVSSNTPTIA